MTNSTDSILSVALLKDFTYLSLYLLRDCASVNWRWNYLKPHQQQLLLNWIQNIDLHSSFSTSIHSYTMFLQILELISFPWKEVKVEKKLAILNYIQTYAIDTTLDTTKIHKLTQMQLFLSVIELLKVVKVPIETQKCYDQLAFSLLTELQLSMQVESVINTNISVSIYGAILQYLHTMDYNKSMCTAEQVSMIINIYLRLFPAINPLVASSNLYLLSNFGFRWSDIPEESKPVVMTHYFQTLSDSYLNRAGKFLYALADLEFPFSHLDKTERKSLFEAVEQCIALDLERESAGSEFEVWNFLQALTNSKVAYGTPIPGSTKRSINALLSRYHDQFSPIGIVAILGSVTKLRFQWHKFPKELQNHLIEAIRRNKEQFTAEQFIDAITRLGKIDASKYNLPEDFLAMIESKLQHLNHSQEMLSERNMAQLTAGLMFLQYSWKDLQPSSRTWLIQQYLELIPTIHKKRLKSFIYLFTMLTFDAFETFDVDTFLHLHQRILARYLQLRHSEEFSKEEMSLIPVAGYCEWLNTLPAPLIHQLLQAVSLSELPHYTITKAIPYPSETHLRFTAQLYNHWSRLTKKKERSEVGKSLEFVNEYQGLASHIFPIDIAVRFQGEIVLFLEIDSNYHGNNELPTGELVHHRVDEFKEYLYRCYYPRIPIWRLDGKKIFKNMEMTSLGMIKRIILYLKQIGKV